jgi:hypothetical protein
MIDTRILVDFITKPFPNEKGARELLAAIQNRPLSGTEFERALFCFQIAFYFLTWLAISNLIEDSLVQKNTVDELHNQIREYYSNSTASVRFSDLIVAPTERELFVESLRQQLNEVDKTRIDVSAPTTSKLTLFDFIGIPRLREYHAAMEKPTLHKFYAVTEQLLFHYGAKKYESVPVMALANLLLGNFASASEMVGSLLQLQSNARDGVSDSIEPMPFSPSIPDITQKPPIQTYASDAYVLFVTQDVSPIGGIGFIEYKYVIAVFDKRENKPLCFVTLESSPVTSNILCVFENNGTHSNYGALEGPNFLQEFMQKGMKLVRERFRIGELAELAIKQQQRSWWKFW